MGGVLGDEMGLGKTIQLIAYLAAVHFGPDSPCPLRSVPTKHARGAVLIICPATIIQQWAAELHRWWPPFRVHVCHGSAGLSDLADAVRAAGKGGAGHVLLTSYGQVPGRLKQFVAVKWDMVVLDEGHKVGVGICMYVCSCVWCVFVRASVCEVSSVPRQLSFYFAMHI